MTSALKAFMKRPTTVVGIVTSLMFQIIFSVIWMTGYNGVTDRVDKLRIAIVNEDAGMGKEIAVNLVKSLPFDMVQSDSLEAAKGELNERNLQMIVYIPSDFSKQVTVAEGQASLTYFINESNPALIKSIMSGATTQITAEVNKSAVSMGIQNTLTAVNVPLEQAVAASASLSQRVTSDVQSSNIVQGMNNQMVPMMMVLASYVGAMIIGMNLEQSSIALAGTICKWRRFAARSVINIVAAIIVALVGSTLLVAFGGQIEQGFLQLWGFQLLFLLTFMFVSQMFLYVFGIAGMLFNIILLSAQLVVSGAIVPRELLSEFYTNLGTVLPATYAVDGTMNILFGGPGVGSHVWMLIVISIAAIAISAVAVKWKGQTVHQHQVVIANHKE
ncbi:ABC transporter permease [Paenibacillus sp. GSMTC-2017]|uniref:YhgE/Pip domain-containing protein n=1 Tax=Paenibacillus sp. GSMTC-2017 TaxID=2794350 RepID=UPI0018D742DB|nr:ABC transporter permease [Paenibacillus sp. GSMTC-2017]MBH5320039.1 ABC transporter permease [Paenibacillus sp. GSMTC-2017]